MRSIPRAAVGVLVLALVVAALGMSTEAGAQTAPTSGAFVTAPTYDPRGFAFVVFSGGSIDDLEAASRGAGASGAWVQDAQGRYQLLVVDGPPFLRADFVAAFPPATGGAPNFTGTTAVTLIDAASSTPAAETVARAAPRPRSPPLGWRTPRRSA